MSDRPARVPAQTVKAWLSEARELAFFDVREAGHFGEAHPFFAIPLTYSRFELQLPLLAPNPAMRMVLVDDGDGVAERAAERAMALGYTHVHVLDGGIAAWTAAGYTAFAGVNLPSKTFGELIEHAAHTPRISADALAAMQARSENHVVVDGRPLAEFAKMSIPGGICCPNGELPFRIGAIAPDPATTIVVNCAGRTRSIIGAQTLIELGVPNPVVALENGTQGWFLAGRTLETGSARRYHAPDAAAVPAAAARAYGGRHGVRRIPASEAQSWIADPQRTTYLLDVRTAEEIADALVRGFVHAPGGQLIQATDQWVGVKGARIALIDGGDVRADVVAAWLRRLGHDAHVIDGGAPAVRDLDWTRPFVARAPAALAPAAISEVAAGVAAGTITLLDLRASMAYRRGHADGACWAIRPRIVTTAETLCPAAGGPIVLLADEPGVAELAAVDLATAGYRDVRSLAGGHAAWVAAGLPITATPADPADADCIDYLFFVHDRHDGNADAARRYLAWETGLVAQLDAQERGVFRL